MRKKESDYADIIYTTLNKRVTDNIKKLIEYKGVGMSQVWKDIRNRDGYSISLSYLSRLLSNSDNTDNTNNPKMPLIYIVQMAEYFGVSIDCLLSENMNLNNLKAQEEQRSPSVKVREILEDYDQESKSGKDSVNLNSDNSDEAMDSTFIKNSRHMLFKSVLQKYHCYFYPTASEETRPDNSILHGTFRIYNEQDKCKVNLTIETNKKDSKEQMVVKTYTGEAVYSFASNSLYCILNDNMEYCFIIFRYFHFRFAFQDCHMALMLSSASATSERYPTALRIFLSKEEIKPEHIPLLASHLKVNFQDISIKDSELSVIQSELPEYSTVIDAIRKKVSADSMYCFKEDIAISAASDALKGAEIDRFIALLRSRSEAYHYIKVGRKVNDTVRELLKSLGYYNED